MFHGCCGSVYDNQESIEMRSVQLIIKRILDIVLSSLAIIVLFPVMLVAAIGVKLSSKGPVLYKAVRMGKNMKPISVYKFRTMHINADQSGSITGLNRCLSDQFFRQIKSKVFGL